jgi:hypothetical protein
VDVELSEPGAPDAWPRCADWARAVGVDPVGTAVAASGWLLVDWPQPWPRDAAEVAALEPVRAALAGSGIRVQLVVPRPDADRATVVLHDRGHDAEGWFSGYRRRARSVDPSDVIDAALGLVADRGDLDDLARADGADGADGAHGADGAGRRERVDRGDPSVDVLLCGHGSRDRCCGSRGTALAMTAAAAGVDVRRTSHTGGHRFAPTGIVLPEGTSWAFLDEAVLDRVVARSGPVDDLLDHYRGSVGLPTPAVQAAERVAFGAVGWSWLSWRRRAVELAPDRVRIDGVDPTGEARSWVVAVAAGRELPVPECGHDPGAAPKSQSEVVVTSVQEVPLPPPPGGPPRPD